MGTRKGIAKLSWDAVEPSQDYGSLGLVARYGQLNDGKMAGRERWDRLVELVVDLLHASGVDARQTRRGVLTFSPAVAFVLDGMPYLIEVTWFLEQVTPAQVKAFHRGVADRQGVRPVLLSMSGFAPAAVEYIETAGALGIVLLDRSHIEAVLCGLVGPEMMLLEARRRSLFDHSPYVPLTDLLVDRTTRQAPTRFVGPDQVPPPWALLVRAAPGVQVRQILAGEHGWGEPLGFAVLSDSRLLVTTAEGIFVVDVKQGATEWALPLAGCRASPLVRPDGAVLTLCNDAVVEWKDGVVTPLAGGCGDARGLLVGPGDEPWMLSGHGPAFGAGAGTLALTRLGARPGQQQQQRYSIRFDANVCAAGWLGGLRFFLASGGSSAVLDLARAKVVEPEDWIGSPHANPGNLVVVDGQVVTASPDQRGVHATIYRTDVARRSSELVAELATNRVHGLAADSDGRLYVLGDVRGNDVRTPRPVLIRVAAATPASLVGLEVGSAAAMTTTGTVDAYDQVRVAARGSRKDYALDPALLARGGQATVFKATHKPTGLRVAFKKLNSHSEDAIARMRREVEAAHHFGGHPHVMPVLDFSPAHDWFVMPLASDTARDLAEELTDSRRLRDLVTAVCDALRKPHEQGWIHRDLKPDNVLKLDGRWTVADWGLGKRPRGQTSDPGRTRTGVSLGTEGFAAPELSTDAHHVTPQTDLYSIGQIICTILTGTRPRANVALLPPAGPWRNIAKAATQFQPDRRPATVDELLTLMARELDDSPVIPANLGEELLAAVREGDEDALLRLIRLAAQYPADFELYMEVIVNLDEDQIRRAVSADPPAAREVVRAMADLHSGGYVTMEYGDVDRLIMWLLVVAKHAEIIEDWDLLEDSADSILYWDLWDRWGVQANIRSWLASLAGDAAAVVATALRRNPDVHSHFDGLANDRRVDHRIRQALGET